MPSAREVAVPVIFMALIAAGLLILMTAVDTTSTQKYIVEDEYIDNATANTTINLSNSYRNVDYINASLKDGEANLINKSNFTFDTTNGTINITNQADVNKTLFATYTFVGLSQRAANLEILLGNAYLVAALLGLFIGLITILYVFIRGEFL